jgi:hypothetical protein
VDVTQGDTQGGTQGDTQGVTQDVTQGVTQGEKLDIDRLPCIVAGFLSFVYHIAKVAPLLVSQKSA